MTDPRHQLPQLDLFTPCAVHACDVPVVEPGDVCTGCQDAFGHMLQPRPTAPCVSPQFEPAHSAGIPERNRPSPTAGASEPTRRANQTCWLCEQRRTCKTVRGRWECRVCTR
ncbi:MAG: hypothetical protein WAW17_30150, partial [Rhodococcus sp. (in: high G+C Gram-positive bacteria)]|uniref:hypothetical protein n=1 Tax=Rhodococcus sp. TaxID=1831 RepID=UPI003BAF7218